MSAPHNTSRYGECWPAQRIALSLAELTHVKPWAIVSGGWAWHFMSPMDHTEYKHAHDHKDIDIFVQPKAVAVVVSRLKQRGFTRVWTKYDKHHSEEAFRRYEKTVVIEDKPTRITIDFFVRDDVPFRLVDQWRVIEPEFLLTLYRNIHSSDKCFAVQAAAKLLAKGIDPVGHSDLSTIPSKREVR